MNIIKSIVLISMIMLIVSSTYCATDSDAEALAKEYFELDYNGARAIVGDLEAIGKLEDRGQQASWCSGSYCDPIFVIGKYEYLGLKRYGENLCADVDFYLVGYIGGRIFGGYLSKEDPKIVRKTRECLPIIKVGNELKVESMTVYPPHISFEAAEKFIKVIYADEVKKFRNEVEKYRKKVGGNKNENN